MKTTFFQNQKNYLYMTGFLLFLLLVGGLGRVTRISDFQDFHNAAISYTEKQDLYHIEEAIQFFQGKDLLDVLKSGNMNLDMIQGKLGSYIYPPTFAFLIQPLGYLGYAEASIVFFLISVLSLAGTIYLFWRYLPGFRWSWMFFALLVNLRFIENHINNNQVGLLLLFLVAIAFFTDIAWLAGFVLALAIAIKLTPALFVLYFIAFKKYRELGYTLLFLLFWILLPFVSGIEYNIMLLDHWKNLVLEHFIKSPVFRAWKNNQSLIATLAKYFVPFADPFNQSKFGMPFVILPLGLIKALHYLLSLALLLPLLRLLKKPDAGQIFSALFILAVLLSGISWVHTFVFFLFPVYYLLSVHEGMQQNDRYLFYALVAIPVVFSQVAGGVFLMLSGLLYTGCGYYYLVLKYEKAEA